MAGLVNGTAGSDRGTISAYGQGGVAGARNWALPGGGDSPAVQRDGPTPAGGPAPITYQGQVLTADPAQLRTLLENLIATRGQAEAETFAYAFLRMGPEEKIRLQLSGVDPQQLANVQQAFEPVLKALQDEQSRYVPAFGPQIVEDTTAVLAKSKELLHQEELKYTSTFPAQKEQPDLDGLRTAATALAAKRKLADAAATKAQAANRAMIDQAAPKADFPSPFPQPIMPFFPNPELKNQAGEANEAWWKLEQDYGALRSRSEQQFPVLAMYSDNEDGGAADRLADLPTSGWFADYRLKDKLVTECRERIANVEQAQSQLDEKKAWQLSRMVDATLKQRAATPYQQRWVHDNAAKLAGEAAEAQKLIAGVAIAVVVVTAVATGGAALAAEGTLAAGVFSAVGAVGAGMSAGMSIATAYNDIRDYQFQKAAAHTDLADAKSISAGEPSLLWVALDLLAAGMDIAAAAAAFKTAAAAIKSVQAGEDVLVSLKAIEGAGKGASGTIIPRVLDEAEASGALQRAIEAAGKQYEQAELGRMKDLIEQGLGRTWGEEFETLKSSNRVLPFTKEGLEGALGPRTAAKIMSEKGFEQTIGMYHLDTGKAFVRPAAEGDLASAMVHELTHAVQGPQRTQYAPFIREFEAYAAQRRMMLQLNEAYGWQPKSNVWLLTANDWDVAKHIRLEYGFAVPPWILEDPLAPGQLDKAFRDLTKRLEQWP